MTVEKLLGSINKVTYKPDETYMEAVKTYYMSMYRAYMVKMYDKGYIDDPTRFNKGMILQNISDFGIVAMSSGDGKVRLTSVKAHHAKLEVRNNYGANDTEGALDFLDLLEMVLKYREYAEAIDHFYDNMNFNKKFPETFKIDFKLDKGSIHPEKKRLKIGKAELTSLVDFKDEVIKESYTDIIWKRAMYELGINKEDWMLSGLFDGGLDHRFELENIKEILNGNCYLSCRGKYYNELNTWLLNHKWNTAGSDDKLRDLAKGKHIKTATNYVGGLYDYLVDSDEVADEVAERVSKKGKEYTPIYIDGIDVYYTRKRETLNKPYGMFAVVGGIADTADKQMKDGTNVYGYTGEVYKKKDLDGTGVNYMGCPVIIWNRNGYYPYYDLEQTDLKCDTWFKDKNYDMYQEGDKKYPKKGYAGLKKSIYDGFRSSRKNTKYLIKKINVKGLTFKEYMDTELSLEKEVNAYSKGE